MLPRYFIRSTFYNIFFFVLTGISCVLLFPTLFFPRRYYLAVVHYFVHTNALLEKIFLNLTYEIRGLENLPTSGSYLVASKHQSTYETFKLHILFKDPAIVLKKELLKIPLWGLYLKKSDVIAIDRSTPKMAIQSIKDGAKRVAAQGRPIVIFPQGTRVLPTTTPTEKPYKIGIIRMQEETGLPIVPLALNTGIFWPRNALWIKKSGKVIFEFLPTVHAGQTNEDTIAEIGKLIEEKSNALMEEGIKNMTEKKKKFPLFLIFLLCIFSLGYTAYWFFAANLVKNATTDFLDNLQNKNPQITEFTKSAPVITGFPGKIHLYLGEQKLKSVDGELLIQKINAQSLPVLGLPIDIVAENIELKPYSADTTFLFEKIEAQITHKNNVLNILSSKITHGETSASIIGTSDFNNMPYPNLDMVVSVENHAPFIEELVTKNLIKPKPALFATMALQSLQRDGKVSLALTIQNNVLYLGPIRILELPEVITDPALLEDGAASAISSRREKPVTPQTDQE